MGPYVHGYEAREATRLLDQAGALEALLHAGTRYPPGARVLEAGCGVGAQTVPLARNSPGAAILAIDRDGPSVARARAAVAAAGLAGVEVRQADLHALPAEGGTFDHVFACFLLEHLPDPPAALAALRAVLRPGGTLTAIEGDHGSALFHPDSEAARAAIAAQVTVQRQAGGDALIGRRLGPLLRQAGFGSVAVEPRQVYADAARPDLVEAFTRRTFTAMIEGVREVAVAAGLLTRAAFEAGLADLRRTAEPDGTLCYTFFKATAVRDPQSAASVPPST